MRTSWNWLSEFVDLSGLTPRKVADALTQAGVEVEKIEEIGKELNGVVLGKIIKWEKHPKADKLSVCEVDVGKEETLQIVCGARNAREGLFSAVATVNTVLPGNFKIKKSKIRGVASFGMLCSTDELGTSDEENKAAGILELQTEYPVGSAIADVLGIRDFVFDISLTPNRPDCLSTFGLAREIAAIFSRKMKREIASKADPFSNAKTPSPIDLKIQDPKGCPRYACAVIENIIVQPSPTWMQQKLKAIGQRPVNNIVDATNYAMFENGQPLHAFDLSTLQDRKIVVRRAKEGETLESIDHTLRKLQPEDLLICDANRPIAIAGVMGGANTEISDKTTDLLLECAYFDPSTVRKSARRFGLHSESSHRFERGTDPNGISACLSRAVELILATQNEINQNCSVSHQPLDLIAKKIDPISILLPKNMPNRILGSNIEETKVVQTLISIGLKVELEDANHFLVTVPTFRPDLTRRIDLVEEIGRMIGFDNLLDALPIGQLGYRHQRRNDAPITQHTQPIQENEMLASIREVRLAVANQGFSEAVNWAIADASKLDALRGEENRILIQNPVTEDRTTMRTTLLTGLLDNIAHNIARGAEKIALFEIGTIFPNTFNQHNERNEPLSFAAVLSGQTPQTWFEKTRSFVGQDLAQLIAVLDKTLRRSLSIVTAPPRIWAHPGITSDITLNNQVIGWIGAIHPKVLDNWKIEQTVFALEINLQAVLLSKKTSFRHVELPKMSSSKRDLALLVDRAMAYAKVREVIDGIKNKFLEQVILFDLYEGENIDPTKKSLALRMTYRKKNGSLTDKQIESAHQRVTNQLITSLDATQR